MRKVYSVFERRKHVKQGWRLSGIVQDRKMLAGLPRRFGGVGVGAADQRGVLVDRQRVADVIALPRVAADVGEEAELFLGFHTLGDNRHFEAVAKTDNGADDRRRLRIASEIDDKRAVALDFVERQRLQIVQRG